MIAKSLRFFPLLLGLFLHPIFNVYGQENLTFDGAFQLGPYTGDAKYTYKVEKADTILDGSFEFQRSSLSALMAKEDVSFLFKGAFENNIPNGPWKFQFGEFRSNENSQVVDYQYRVSVSGVQETAIGQIQNGKPHGPWIYEVDRITDSKVQDTLFISSFEFENGIPLRSFRIKGEKSTLVGRFLRDGLAHDEWALYGKDEIESSQIWYFANGRLKKIQFYKDGEKEELDVYREKLKEFKTINLDRRFLTALKISLKPSDSMALSNGIPALLSKNVAYYENLNSILSELGQSSFRPELKVKVPFYPLDSADIDRVNAIKQWYQKSISISDSLLNNTQLNILRRSDKQASLLFAALFEISEQFLRPLGKMVSYADDKILEFVPFAKVVSNIWPNGLPSKEISLRLDDAESEKFLGPNASRYDFSETTITSFHQMAEYAKGSVDSISKKLRPKLASIEQRKEFVTLEKNMIEQIKRLNEDKESVENQLPSEQLKVLDNIKSVSDSSLGHYSKMEVLSDKMEFGRKLYTCFSHLEELEKVILNLSADKDKIKKTYEDEIWNPFMANLMTEEVKKRLTNAYFKVIVPHLLQEASTNLSCDTTEGLVEQFKNTHRRMLELRNADTKKLERKLKRERDAHVIMQLFQIEPQGKTEQ